MKKVKKLFCTFLAGAFMLFQAGGTAFGIGFKGKPTYNPELATYLINNHSQSSDIIDTDKYELFISGEGHATQKNFDVEMDIIKNLTKNAGLKYIIAEDNMASATLINNYLQTGNISNLDIVFNTLKGTLSGNNEEYKFLQNLYEFNKTLPADKKLTYLGMDLEYQPELAIGYLADIALRKGIFEILKEFINDYEQNASLEKMLASLEAIYKDVEDKSEVYSQKLGDEFWEFEYLLRNYINTVKYHIMDSKGDYLNANSVRERAMTENFYKIYEHFPKGKYYGQWGREHAFLNNVKTNCYPANENRLATALNSRDDSPVKNKVCSMAIVYFDSLQMNRSNKDKPYAIYENFSNKKNEMDTLKIFAQDNIQFLKLDAENSPFSKELYLFNNMTETGSTTDYFKYLIVVKNSKPCTAFEN